MMLHIRDDGRLEHLPAYPPRALPSPPPPLVAVVGVLHSPSFLLCASSSASEALLWCVARREPCGRVARGARGGVIAPEKRLLFLRSRCNVGRRRERGRDRIPVKASSGLVIALRHTIGGIHALVPVIPDREPKSAG